MPDLTIFKIPLNEIYADDDFNCRGGKIAPIDVVDLAKSIEQRGGLIQPVSISTLPEDHPKLQEGYKYRLLAGFRRYKAHQVLKWDKIEAILREDLSEDDAIFFNVSENLDRKDLTFSQEATVVRRLMDRNHTEDEIAKKIGKSRGWVQIRTMFNKLPTEVQTEIEADRIGQGSIRDLYTIQRNGKKEDVLDAAKSLKEAKAAGRKAKVEAKRKGSATQKKIRTRQEMFDLMSHLRQSFGNGLHTRVLAWCAGEISNGELVETLREEAENRGRTYIPSRELIDS